MTQSTEDLRTLVADLYQYPRYTGLSGRLDRPVFLYRSNETGVPLLYLHTPTAPPQLLTPGDESVSGVVALHATQPRIAIAKDDGGSENYALHTLNYETGAWQQITPEPIGRIGAIHWLTDDSWLVVSGDKTNNFVARVAADGAMTKLYETGRWLFGAAYDSTNNRLYLSAGRGKTTTNYDIAVIEVATGEIATWISDSDDSMEAFLDFHAGRLAYGTDAGETYAVVVRDETGTTGRFPVPGDLYSLKWVDATTIMAVVAHHAVQAPRLLDVATGRWSDPLGDGSTWYAIATANGPVWAESALHQPNRLCGYRDGQVETLLTSPTTTDYTTAESHWYESFDGRQVQGWLVRHPNPDAPLVVYVHGGPTSVTANMWREDIQSLGQAGFHVFAPNFRGSTSFGVEFRELNIGDIGGGDMQDVLYGANYARELLGVKGLPAITGRSYGGYLTLFALTTQPEQWQGGVAIVPVADWVEDYYLLDAGFRFYDEHFFGGSPEEKPALYKERSPITYIDNLRAPTLIIHGANDSRCAIEPVIRFTDEAKKRGLPVEMIITEDEGHGNLQTANAIRDMTYTLKHLQSLWS